MKRKILLLALSLAVAALVFLNSWQGYRYHELAADVEALESRQREMLEANRDKIAEIARERSASSIAGKAALLGLEPIDPSRITRIASPSDGGGR